MPDNNAALMSGIFFWSRGPRITRILAGRARVSPSRTFLTWRDTRRRVPNIWAPTARHPPIEYVTGKLPVTAGWQPALPRFADAVSQRRPTIVGRLYQTPSSIVSLTNPARCGRRHKTTTPQPLARARYLILYRFYRCGYPRERIR